MSDLSEICQKIYEEEGQGAVFDYIEEYHKTQGWAYCEPCETKSPTDEGDCLVCGSIVVTKAL